ncbi:uncharacterized protein LOC115629555 [Scaptodrosophila lebanonensis]|uniref:Uncharacterized protein LOC115629555 n=1 Tax=Drosophila lebanonensis TaxID=7225 RepID=A0A6J2U1Y8_DROLE|nr:uncharacterized protein LOC115629555 [Scaptodrosophila lebanonensis]XP_030381905.1 uncharacterized protein LOC115629555 [Scaptodrosophila lebanonensis]XP_030381906.1 uncharacterized protein LOC115629555 [Scaptodrosophila lebanonensis]
MDKLRSVPGTSSNISYTGNVVPPSIEQQQDNNSEDYPKTLIEQYMRASGKIKKIERTVFKRFAPNVTEVQADFQRLAYSFEDMGIMQYAAMCHMGFAKCESYGGAKQREAEAYVRAARDFMFAHSEFGTIHMRTAHNGFREGALHCYNKASERVADGGVAKASVLRELKYLHNQLDRTSAFASPAHRINDLELAAEQYMRRGDYLGALQQYDDIVDNIYERKRAGMYGELLRQAEVMRLMLLVHLNLTPVRQSPAHIKLLEYYYSLAIHPEEPSDEEDRPTTEAKQTNKQVPGAFVPEYQRQTLAEIVCAWVERKLCELKVLIMHFSCEFCSISNMERQLVKKIYSDLCKIF